VGGGLTTAVCDFRQPENVLLGSDGHICLTDFGLAKEVTIGDNDEDGRAR
jgi:serine/threonine protein kinase